MKPTETASRPEVHSGGLRSSDKGFLSLTKSEYLKLLRWTARQTSSAMSNMPERLPKKLASVGISAGMWRDLVWHEQKYFGRSVCVGKPDAMRQQAEATGHYWHRGQAAAACCCLLSIGGASRECSFGWAVITPEVDCRDALPLASG